MAVLVTLAEFKDYLGLVGVAEDARLQAVLDAAESLLAGRTARIFTAAAETVSDEPHDGTGKDVLYLHRPASAVTHVKLGTDPAAPDETIAASELAVDGQRLVRLGGGIFPEGRRNAHVTYTAAVYPTGAALEIARAAIKTAGAFMWHRRGREHIRAETIGEFGSVTLDALLERQDTWAAAVDALRDRTVR